MINNRLIPDIIFLFMMCKLNYSFSNPKNVQIFLIKKLSFAFSKKSVPKRVSTLSLFWFNIIFFDLKL